jgi:ribosome-associated toxin RatA of RatAB toxin-antitoxin module
MKVTRRSVSAWVVGAGTALWLPPALRAEDVDRTRATRYRFPTPNSDIETGGAIIGVNGPMAEVFKVVTSYARYVDILPRLSMSKVVKRDDESQDVYLRAPILNGVANIWGVSRFTPYKWGTKGKKVVGRYLKGNLDAFHGLWKMYPCGPRRTVLRLELFVDPQVPVPASSITPELEWASDKGVTAVRDIVECDSSSVKDD